jgi:hypothetical protein
MNILQGISKVRRGRRKQRLLEEPRSDSPTFKKKPPMQIGRQVPGPLQRICRTKGQEYSRHRKDVVFVAAGFQREEGLGLHDGIQTALLMNDLIWTERNSVSKTLNGIRGSPVAYDGLLTGTELCLDCGPSCYLFERSLRQSTISPGLSL